VINWTVVKSTKFTIPPSSAARPLVYHSDLQALSTARVYWRQLILVLSVSVCSEQDNSNSYTWYFNRVIWRKVEYTVYTGDDLVKFRKVRAELD